MPVGEPMPSPSPPSPEPTVTGKALRWRREWRAELKVTDGQRCDLHRAMRASLQST
jgi:hypothetical protein